MDFKFKIGDVVAVSSQVLLFGMEEAAPLVVHERVWQECEGGVQRHYTCKAIGSLGVARESVNIKESMLELFDIEAFKASRHGPAWGRTFRELEALEKAVEKQKTEQKS